MYQEPNNTFSNIKKQLNIILLNSTFADRVDLYTKISNMITFPEDIDIIKSHIKRIFKYEVEQNIAEMTPYELIQKIYQHNKGFTMPRGEVVFTQRIKNNSKIIADMNDTEWSRKSIFAYFLANLARAMGRTVQSTEKISDLMAEAAMSGSDLENLHSKLRELENFFGIKIDQSMKVYNAANAAEESFVAQGRAPAPKDTKDTEDPFWNAIMAATSIKYLKSILQNNLNVHVSTYVLSRVKSYEEFKVLIQSKQRQK